MGLWAMLHALTLPRAFLCALGAPRARLGFETEKAEFLLATPQQMFRKRECPPLERGFKGGTVPASSGIIETYTPHVGP